MPPHSSIKNLQRLKISTSLIILSNLLETNVHKNYNNYLIIKKKKEKKIIRDDPFLQAAQVSLEVDVILF